MKHTFLSILAAGALLLPALSAGACAATAPDQAPESQQRFAPVVNPAVPRSMTFCDQKIDLDRSDMYERLDRELSAMAYTHGTTMLTIKRANRYFPEIIPVLRRSGVPDDLIYLACIESSLNPLALSGAKAAGLWQFMPATAKEFGLEVNDYVDERYHTEKATQAACKYLKNAYAKYGNWESVAASYNAGQGRISQERERQQQASAYDLFLNQETSRYIYRMLAMKAIMEDPAAYGYRLTDSDLYQPYEYETVKVTGPVDDWVAWAADHGITYLQLRDHNPWIRARSLPNKTGKTYEVKIPDRRSLSRSTQHRHTYNPNWTVR